MQDIREKIKIVSYICRDWCMDKYHLFTAWVKNRYAEIKDRGIKEKLRELWIFHKPRVISVTVVAVAAVIGITTAAVCGHHFSGNNTVIDSELKEEQEEILLDAKLPSGAYEVKKVDGQANLFVDGKEEKAASFDKLPVFYFSTTASDASDEILKMADADKTGNTGGQVYRGKRVYAERFYAYLLSNGYSEEAYIKTGSYLDTYFSKDGQLFRFLYIKKTDDSGALIFGECSGDIPDSIDDILKEK